MAMSEQEKQAYQAYLDGAFDHVNAVADRVFRERDGRTWRPDEIVPKKATVLHGEQNGSSRKQDSLEQIRRDFPSLFGANES
jgi:hypothetical protein